METVYIIGNGFDLHHGLKTSYSEFYKYIIANSNDLENAFEEYFDFRTEGESHWAHFEEDLGTFKKNRKSFFSDYNNLNIEDEDFRPSFAYSLEDDLTEQVEQLKTDIKKKFEDWFDTIDVSCIKKKCKFLENSIFINFNYTLLLEEVYKIEANRILHIHGDLSNDSRELVFGHNATMKEIPELDENGDSNRTLFTDSENAAKSLHYHFYKPVEEIIFNNLKTFNSLTNVKNIYILGHSLNPIDLPYFEQIHMRSKNAQWFVSYHVDSDKEEYLSTLTHMGISPGCINLFKL